MNAQAYTLTNYGSDTRGGRFIPESRIMLTVYYGMVTDTGKYSLHI